VDRNSADYNDVRKVTEWFVENIGGTVEILPKLHYKDDMYDSFFGDLKGTPYYGKCPDFRVNNHFYELEGFTPESNPKQRLSSMLRRGLRQSSRVVIMDEGSTGNHILKIINLRIKEGQKIDEVWKWTDSGVIKIH
jgi:hypothetical protein